MKFSGSKESAWGAVGNATVTTGPRKTAPELSDSLVNDPLRVNDPVPTGPQSIVSNFRCRQDGNEVLERPAYRCFQAPHPRPI
jgi:hypothetical protein